MRPLLAAVVASWWAWARWVFRPPLVWSRFPTFRSATTHGSDGSRLELKVPEDSRIAFSRFPFFSCPGSVQERLAHTFSVGQLPHCSMVQGGSLGKAVGADPESPSPARVPTPPLSPTIPGPTYQSLLLPSTSVPSPTLTVSAFPPSEPATQDLDRMNGTATSTLPNGGDGYTRTERTTAFKHTATRTRMIARSGSSSGASASMNAHTCALLGLHAIQYRPTEWLILWHSNEWNLWEMWRHQNTQLPNRVGARLPMHDH